MRSARGFEVEHHSPDHHRRQPAADERNEINAGDTQSRVENTGEEWERDRPGEVNLAIGERIRIDVIAERIAVNIGIELPSRIQRCAAIRDDKVDGIIPFQRAHHDEANAFIR
jgi:hypothetical protein